MWLAVQLSTGLTGPRGAAVVLVALVGAAVVLVALVGAAQVLAAVFAEPAEPA